MIKMQTKHIAIQLMRLFLCVLLIQLSGLAKAAFSRYELARLRPQYASVPLGQIEFFRFGQGSPILLISGYGTTLSSWNRFFLLALIQIK